MEYSLKNLGLCIFLLVEGFEQGALRKELIIVPSLKMFLKFWQISQENTRVGVSF